LRENQWGGGSFLLHFYVEVFQNLYRGYMRCPPPPLCASMSLEVSTEKTNQDRDPPGLGYAKVENVVLGVRKYLNVENP
jgi:hypothetical protein